VESFFVFLRSFFVFWFAVGRNEWTGSRTSLRRPRRHLGQFGQWTAAPSSDPCLSHVRFRVCNSRFAYEIFCVQYSILTHPVFRRFYMYPHYIETTTFGVSCDAYTNLKETLTKHKTIVAEFLDKNYDRVSSISVFGQAARR
jgi:hypothetical protein